MIPYDPRNLEGYGDGHEDGYCAGVQDGVRSERARVRREEVEPLREALCWLVNTCSDVGRDGNPPTMNEHLDAIKAGRAALRSADERGK